MVLIQFNRPKPNKSRTNLKLTEMKLYKILFMCYKVNKNMRLVDNNQNYGKIMITLM